MAIFSFKGGCSSAAQMRKPCPGFGQSWKGMEKEAMECYEEACGENSMVKMSAVAYNYVLDALSKNEKFDEALRLFDRMKNEHNPPRRLAVNLGSFNVIVDVYCTEGKFKEAMDVFRSMLDYRRRPDTLSFNNLIDQLCQNGLLVEAEELYGGMGVEGVSPDEYTYVLLIYARFKVNRIDDGASYFRKMVEAGLRPNLAVYNREGNLKLQKQPREVPKLQSHLYFHQSEVPEDESEGPTEETTVMESVADSNAVDAKQQF
ncbi:Detected protein of unknown function [Hibiscus syriacus]|uniref:Pentatricopeptide repeat-containing protein n=1 Tax=Hibiscus syriacus TaxID=106335 RepID=A0A6A2X2J4_HIBSY|nr:Detected protein of unknown function [Hibiscus syriacus]